MSRIVQVVITQDEINIGVPKDCERCACAIAMERAGLDIPQVGDDLLTWYQPGLGRIGVPTPPDVIDFISLYDSERGVADPLTFEIDTDEAQPEPPFGNVELP